MIIPGDMYRAKSFEKTELRWMAKETKNLRVLAVDDEDYILNLYKQILAPQQVFGDISPPALVDTSASDLSFDVICCSQGNEAIETVKRSLSDDQPFAVVFLDLNMPPGPDGEYTADQIQKLDPDANIVLVTGYMSEDIGSHPYGASIGDKMLYLQKPFHRQEIIQFATALGTKWLAERQLRNLHVDMEQLVDERTHELVRANEQLKVEIESRQEAQKALRMSEINFRNMINNNADGILILDQNSIVRFINPAAASIFGSRVENYVGQTFEHLFVPGEDTELEIKSGEGKHIIAEMRVMETEWEGEKAHLASLRDITDRKRMQLKLEKSFDKLETAMNGTIQAMARTLEMRDPYTSGHQQRVAEFARAIALELGLPAEQIEGTYMAATIHDIGKISLPAEILSKPVPLSKLEVQMIHSHSQVGYDILKGIEFPWPIAQIVLQHHEKPNGSGYPQGLTGDDILLEAKIICVADVVETMASHRPYRPSIGMDKALEEITSKKGKLYDPRIVDVALELLNEKGFRFPNANNS